MSIFRHPLRLMLVLPGFVSAAFGAEISWTGAGGDSYYVAPQNWSGGVVPGASDTVIFESRRALRHDRRILDFNNGAAFGTLIVDVPNFGLRSGGDSMGSVDSTLNAHGDIIFRSGHSISDIRTFSSAKFSNDSLVLFRNPVRIVNNSAGTVSFSNNHRSGWSVRSEVDGDLILSGPGDFIWYGGLVHESVRRFGTDRDFTGTLTVFDERSGGTVLRPHEGIEVLGGTIIFASDEVVEDSTALRIGGGNSVVDFSGRTETLGELVALEGGGTLRVDADTLLFFSGVRLDDVLNIEGFVEGRTRIAFPESTEGIGNLRINGKPAYWAAPAADTDDPQ